jgi:hypothetical protein
MAVSTDLEVWASSDGAAVAGPLTITAAQWQSNVTIGSAQYGVIRFTCSGSPDLSAVIAGHVITVTGFTNANNNGENMTIYAVNNSTDVIDVLMPERTSNSDDQTGATASGSVTTTGARRKKPSTSKFGLGFAIPEKPSDGHVNWVLNRITDWIIQTLDSDDAIFSAETQIGPLIQEIDALKKRIEELEAEKTSWVTQINTGAISIATVTEYDHLIEVPDFTLRDTDSIFVSFPFPPPAGLWLLGAWMHSQTGQIYVRFYNSSGSTITINSCQLTVRIERTN